MICICIRRTHSSVPLLPPRCPESNAILHHTVPLTSHSHVLFLCNYLVESPRAETVEGYADKVDKTTVVVLWMILPHEVQLPHYRLSSTTRAGLLDCGGACCTAAGDCLESLGLSVTFGLDRVRSDLPSFAIHYPCRIVARLSRSLKTQHDYTPESVVLPAVNEIVCERFNGIPHGTATLSVLPTNTVTWTSINETKAYSPQC